MRKKLLSIIERFPNTRVAVIADIIADEFVFGEIRRVSREAPVLILKHAESRIVPGGGGNAINNLRSLGAVPVPFGCVGRDDAGDALIEVFRTKGIPTAHVLRVKSCCTTRKTRILASLPHSNRQQVLRIDREDGIIPPMESLHRYLSNVLPLCDGLLISDYGLGSVPNDLSSYPGIRSFARKSVTTVDSRYRILSYNGLTAATPNEGEVDAALGVKINDDPDALERAGRKMLRQMQCGAILITRGNKGMSLFEPRKRALHIPIYGGEEITDVTGAGDTVIAAFTLALCCGATYEEAAILANHSGGLVVMKRGTATISREELMSAIQTDPALQ